MSGINVIVGLKKFVKVIKLKTKYFIYYIGPGSQVNYTSYQYF